MNAVCLCLLAVAGSSLGARILGVYPTPSISHQLPFQAVMRALAWRGHDVTVLSTDPLKTPHANYTDIDLSFTYDYWRQEHDFAAMDDMGPYEMMDVFTRSGVDIAHLQLSSKVVQDFIKSEPKFDLVFIENLMYQAYYGLIHHVGSPPIIGMVSLGGMASSYDTVANPNHPAYDPDLMMPYDDHMDFWQRLDNMLYGCYMRYNWRYNMLPAQERVMRQYFGAGPPSVHETERNYSLFMVNNHWTLSYPRPLVPSYIELGSLHLQTETKPLPKDLSEFLDGASDGFVYFSLGSNVRSDKLPEHKRQQLLEAFAQLPQRVLWKWESDTLPGQPSNVKLGKWLPQQDILAHPNIRLFVTQGGLQSLQEATRHAVPLVGIPFIGDQKHNVRKIVSAGIGLHVDFKTADSDVFLTTMQAVINDPKYRDAMKRVSAINKDQPETSIERAVWWTEYVLRHNGAKHLRSAALDLTWWQYLLLDVIAFLLLSFIVTSIVVYYIVKRLLSFILRITSKPKQE